MPLTNPEQRKYDALWGTEEYRRVAPGESLVDLFREIAGPPPGASITDFGCGTGRPAASLRKLFKTVLAVDFSDSCLDPEVRKQLGEDFRFEKRDLTDKNHIPVTPTDYGFCTDVLEHIPPELVEQTLENILASAKWVFFMIDCAEDSMGALIGAPLHLTVKPYAWWKETFERLGYNVLHSFDLGTRCMIYASRWASPSSFLRVSSVNVSEHGLVANINSALDRGLSEARPYALQDTEVVILAGGPSLSDYVNEIRELYYKRVPIVTVNGAYAWAYERGIVPSAQIIVDAREFNFRFLAPIIPSCTYMLASQCHPMVFDAVPAKQTLLWHSGRALLQEVLDARGDDSDHYAVAGGTTSVLRAIPLLNMLGFRRFIIFGFDSCLIQGRHHAYPQTENDGPPIVDIDCGGRVFKCHPWMVVQASEFSVLQNMLDCEFDVRGDGLISNMIKYSYNLAIGSNS